MRKHRLSALCALLCILILCVRRLDAQDDCAGGLPADIYFLVDSSWSMGQENFEHVREFLYSVVEGVEGGREHGFQFALVQYSGSPRTEFRLDTYATTPRGVLAHIRRALAYRGGGTRTGLGLDFLTRAHMTAASGSRVADGAAQLVVVLTDGRSQDDVSEPAAVLHLAGVEVFAVGVRDAADWELAEMASAPHDAHVFAVDTFPALRDVAPGLVAAICAAVARAWAVGEPPMAIEARQVRQGGPGNGERGGGVSLCHYHTNAATLSEEKQLRAAITGADY